MGAAGRLVEESKKLYDAGTLVFRVFGTTFGNR